MGSKAHKGYGSHSPQQSKIEANKMEIEALRKEYTQMITDMKKLKGIPQKFRQLCGPEGVGQLVGYSAYDLITMIETGWKKTVFHYAVSGSSLLYRVTINGHHYRDRVFYKALCRAVIGEWDTVNQIAVERRFKKW